MNVLFICTGNTCRSPMAEGYLNAQHLSGVKAISRGLYVAEREPAENAVAAMQDIGIDISAHLATPVTAEELAQADRIICLAETHKTALGSVVGSDKITVLGGGIPDPFGGDQETYRICREAICKAIDELVANGAFTPFHILPDSERPISKIAALERECFAEPWSENAIAESYDAGTRFIVAAGPSGVIGYVGVSIIAGEAYITNVAVTKSARQTGVGSLLMAQMITVCRQNDAEFVSLEVRVSNQPAIALYEKFGFELAGERKNFYRFPTENALIMTKRF
ncbi:MAG: ribosomal protein S18-alanine N-acetyltransferase [Clostridia bacterium]|nr:ribosomal protein S18-alanine N-acetyltransferase [Clostridia bacterium]